MLRTKALELAAEAALILTANSRRLARTPTNQQGVFPTLALSLAASEEDIASLDPSIKKILIFGSIAQGKTEVGDIDMMVLDTGFYSRILTPKNGQTEEVSSDDDCYSKLRLNLSIMLRCFFDIRDHDPRIAKLAETKIDLHVLPVSILTDRALR